MNGDVEEKSLIGVKVVSDVLYTYTNNHIDIEGVVIGTIACNDLKLQCKEFRQILISKLPCLPEEFRFLTKDGWPIEREDEGAIEVSQLVKFGLVTIQKMFALPRLGIKWSGGKYLGFIFINFNSHLKEVRGKILSELSEKFQVPETDFEFIDKNEWPIAVVQENQLTVWDVCNGNFCSINKLPNKRNNQIIHHKSKKRRLKLDGKESFQKKQSVEEYNPNSILISYVHCEASTHARDLKNELVNMGLESVFLDVDDIPAGQDWQDVINTALNNCTAFVALVTPRYGETRWTNREAKLADERLKQIIPISFLEKWPPDQLAIQFLSLQYIPWKTHDEFGDVDDHDITYWDQRCIHRVAKEIQKLCFEQDVSTPDSTTLFATKQQVENGIVKESIPFPSAKQCLKEGHLAISAHSEQNPFVEGIMMMLEKDGFNVWSSANILISNGDAESSYEDSQLSEPSSLIQSPLFDSYSHDKAFGGSQFPSTSRHLETLSKACYKEWKDPEEVKILQGKGSRFKNTVKKAKLVIIVMSEDYTKSCFCRQQAFYCEHRKEVIVIKYGDFLIDDILTNLYPEQEMLKFTKPEEENLDVLYPILKQEISKRLESGKTRRQSIKNQIQNKIIALMGILSLETCVYIIGGTSDVSKNATEFCVALGAELSHIPSLTLVTEGFFGAGELIGKNFCEDKDIRAKGKPHNLYHIVPYKDSNITDRARQKSDGTFERIPHGETLFYGESVSERDDIVSSTFKICILVEGGERSACLAQKFLWNDCTVIPVIFNNRSASFKHCLRESMLKVPCGVNSNDWSTLLRTDSPAEILAKSVRKIVTVLLKTRLKEKKSIQNKV